MNIQNLTLEQISIAILFIVGLYGGVKYLKKEIKDFFDKLFDAKLKPLTDKVNYIDAQACKNFLVRYLADIERGTNIFDTERQRFWEEYDHYTIDLKENSYIKEWVAKLRNEGKLVRPSDDKKGEGSKDVLQES